MNWKGERSITCLNSLRMSPGANPFYIDVPGWREDITDTESFVDLPENARLYVQLLEELMGVEIEYISVGPGRSKLL